MASGCREPTSVVGLVCGFGIRLLDPFEEIARLALEHAAHGVERAEAHRLGAPFFNTAIQD